MKKTIAAAAAFLMIITFSGCDESAENSASTSASQARSAVSGVENSSEFSSSVSQSAEISSTKNNPEASQSDTADFSGNKSQSAAENAVHTDMTGIELAKALGVGWNLGNTFDASDCTWVNDELLYESAWNGSVTTKKHIEMIKEAGFSSVRIPVSWHNHVTDNYAINEAWLDRVNEVVDWCLERGLYVILNIHHDNSTEFMYPTRQYLGQSVDYVTAIWRQLAFRFSEYDERLIFETLNEPRMIGHTNEWWIDENNADCKEAIACINEINQAAVNTIRASGGNNRTRFITCPGYDASAEGALNAGYVVPTDPAGNNGRILVTVHAYTPYNFALEEGGVSEWSSANENDLRNMTDFMDKLYEKFVSRGAAVIIDEFGARNKGDNTAPRADFAGAYVREAKNRGMPCFWWDNNAMQGGGELFGLLDRKQNVWAFPNIVNALTGQN